MRQNIPSIVGASIADFLDAFGLGAANLAGEVIGGSLARVMGARRIGARDILLQEIGEGARPLNDPGEVDEFVAILYRYLRAAQEGTARLNLRLMSRIIKSQMEGEGLYASDFLRYADIISSLTREEVIMLATRYRVRVAFKAHREREDWSDAQQVNRLVADALIPKLFKTRIELEAAMTALQRTGMIVAGGPAGGSYSTDASNGGTIWIDTPLLGTIVTLAKAEGAIEAEDDLEPQR